MKINSGFGGGGDRWSRWAGNRAGDIFHKHHRDGSSLEVEEIFEIGNPTVNSQNFPKLNQSSSLIKSIPNQNPLFHTAIRHV